MPQDELRRLRAKAQKVNREQHAIFALMQRTTVEEYAVFHDNMAKIGVMPKQRLRLFVARVSAQTSQLKKKLGIRMSDDLLEVFDSVCNGPPGTMLFLTKGMLLSFCRNYAIIVEDLDQWPAHTKIGVEDGSDRTEAGRYRIVIGEIQAFQDLAALHNAAERLWNGLDYVHADAETRKTLDAFCRSSTVAAYQLIEAYLNGISFDFLFEAHPAISKADELTLKEEGAHGRIKFTSFKNKLLHYPRIVTGDTTPILDENNCPEVKLLLDRNKRVRDAIVHTSPRSEIEEYEPGKGLMIAQVDFTEVLALSMAAVALVRKLEVVIRGDESRLLWLEDLQGDGRFARSVFE